MFIQKKKNEMFFSLGLAEFNTIMIVIIKGDDDLHLYLHAFKNYFIKPFFLLILFIQFLCASLIPSNNNKVPFTPSLCLLFFLIKNFKKSQN